VPLADGGVQIEWRGPSGELEVQIWSPEELGYLFVKGEGPSRVFEEKDGASWTEILRLVVQVIIA
jgi:hypothetical protein